MLLDADAITAALGALDEYLGRSGVRAELFLVGGAVLCVVHHARPSTRDVDGWFAPAAAVREGAAAVGRDRGLPADWLNDAAKGFLPANVATECYPPEQLPIRAQLLVEEMFG